MPRLNTFGQALCSPYPDGAGTISVDRQELLGAAGQACWLDEETVIANAQIAGVWRVAAILATGGTPPIVLDAGGANRIVAGGGRWLGWAAGRGMFGSLGDKPAAGVLAAGHDGTLAWVRDYQDGGGLVLSAPDGAVTLVPDARVRDLQVLGPRAALWQDFAGGLRVVGRDPVQPALPAGRTRLATVDGEDWLVYWSEGTGLIVQRDGATDGYVIETRPIAFHHDAVAAHGLLVVAWAITEAERPKDLVWLVVDRTLPRRSLEVPMAVIGRPLWLGWFEFGLVVDTPANCGLLVGDPMFVQDLDGAVVAQYVASQPEGDPVALAAALEAARRRFPNVPRLAYWTRGPQAGAVPSSELVGIEAYRGIDETLEAFEARLRLVTEKVTRAGATPWLIAQGYTSNASLTSDVAGLVPVYARVCRDLPSIQGLLVFSAGARATGWTDHPEIHDAWRRLADGVPGAPALPPTPHPPPTDPVPRPPDHPHPNHPAPPPPAFSFTEGDLIMLTSKFTDPASKGLLVVESIKPLAGRDGIATLILPGGRVFSMQPGGVDGDRDPGTEGPWECCRPSGSVATFHVDGQYYTRGFVLGAGLE